MPSFSLKRKGKIIKGKKVTLTVLAHVELSFIKLGANRQADTRRCYKLLTKCLTRFFFILDT